jgi:hypothetical protein
MNEAYCSAAARTRSGSGKRSMHQRVPSAFLEASKARSEAPSARAMPSEPLRVPLWPQSSDTLTPYRRLRSRPSGVRGQCSGCHAYDSGRWPSQDRGKHRVSKCSLFEPSDPPPLRFEPPERGGEAATFSTQIMRAVAICGRITRIHMLPP